MERARESAILVGLVLFAAGISGGLLWLTLDVSVFWFIAAFFGLPLFAGFLAGWPRLPIGKSAVIIAAAVLPYAAFIGVFADEGDMGREFVWFAAAVYAFLMSAFSILAAMMMNSLRTMRIGG